MLLAGSFWLEGQGRKRNHLGRSCPSGRMQTCSTCDWIIARIILPHGLKYQTWLPIATGDKGIGARPTAPGGMDQPSMMSLSFSMVAPVVGKLHTKVFSSRKPNGHTVETPLMHPVAWQESSPGGMAALLFTWCRVLYALGFLWSQGATIEGNPWTASGTPVKAPAKPLPGKKRGLCPGT